MFQCSCDSGKTVHFKHILQTGTLKSLFVCESVSAIQTLQIKPCLQKCVCVHVCLILSALVIASVSDIHLSQL